MVIERLRARFREPLEVELENVHERFREEKQDDIEEARERVEALQERVADALEELDGKLRELEGYEDVEGRTVIEDVADNIVSDRRRMVDRFSVPDDPGELHEELAEFVDRFKTMKRKETEVLKVLGDDKKPVFDALGRVEDAKEELGTLLEEEYSAVETAETLERLEEELEELEGRTEEIEEDLEALDLEFTREKIGEVEESLDALHAGEEWEEYRELQAELEEVEEARKEIRGAIVRAANRMERGLKKLLYESPPLDGRDVLEDIRDGNVADLLEREPGAVEEAVRSAVETMPGDLLGERQEEKFREAAGEMQKIGERVDRIGELREEIQELEAAVEEHPAPEKEAGLASELDGLQEQLQEGRKERRELREALEDAEEEMERVRERIEQVVRDAFRREVEVA